ncbi:MAG: M48 family metalloprotease [Deltaproteobacteria bacterium]|nr:M48 family metalloprotease [Deltaproteobacteria bacterium]
MKTLYSLLGLALAALLALTSCQTLESAAEIATVIGQGTGAITETQAESIRKSTKAVARSAEEFTPEQEYYIGRSVGAVVLTKYRAFDNAQLNRYVNLLGQTLAQASDLPSLFGGYHFLVLDSDDINAFATPSGLIFVTRGLLRCCRTEDALAAVLTHEVGHIECRHGMEAIEKARFNEVAAILGTELAKNLGSREVAQLTETFGGVITDVTTTMINKGYARGSEYEADRAAVKLLRRVGYDPSGLTEMLLAMKRNLKPGGLDFVKTHPAPDDRIAELRKDGVGSAAVRPVAARQKRFQQSMVRI